MRLSLLSASIESLYIESLIYSFPSTPPIIETTQEDNPRKGYKTFQRTKAEKAKNLRFCAEPKPLFDIMQHLGLKARKNLMNVYITPMIEAGLLEMTEPDNPTSRNQLFSLTQPAQNAISDFKKPHFDYFF